MKHTSLTLLIICSLLSCNTRYGFRDKVRVNTHRNPVVQTETYSTASIDKIPEMAGPDDLLHNDNAKSLSSPPNNMIQDEDVKVQKDHSKPSFFRIEDKMEPEVDQLHQKEENAPAKQNIYHSDTQVYFIAGLVLFVVSAIYILSVLKLGGRNSATEQTVAFAILGVVFGIILVLIGLLKAIAGS